jgi:LPXTG-motif cell wall-anchored protein
MNAPTTGEIAVALTTAIGLLCLILVLFVFGT